MHLYNLAGARTDLDCRFPGCLVPPIYGQFWCSRITFRRYSTFIDRTRIGCMS